MSINGKTLVQEGIIIAVEAVADWKGGQTKAAFEKAVQTPEYMPGAWFFNHVAGAGDMFLASYAKRIVFNRLLEAGTLLAKAADIDRAGISGEDDTHHYFETLVNEGLTIIELMLDVEKIAHGIVQAKEIHKSRTDSLAQLRKVVREAQPPQNSELWFSSEDLIAGLESEYKGRKEAVEEANTDAKRGEYRVGF